MKQALRHEQLSAPNGSATRSPMLKPCLSISGLGPFKAEWNGHAIAQLGNGKPAALLTYLIAEPGAHRRETLAELFWPEMSSESARLNLRQLTFNLRNLLWEASGREFLIADRHHLAFDAASPHHADFSEFSAPLPDCICPSPEKCAGCLVRLTTLADYYRGPLLSDLSLPNSPDFDNWLEQKRELMQRHALDLLARIADCHEQRGNFRAALPFALRYTTIEPWSEAGYLRTMRLYMLDGQPDAALAQYEACCRKLRLELGIAPNPALQTFANRLHDSASLASPKVPASSQSEDKRQVSVLYCELESAGIDDPEDVISLLRLPKTRCAEIIQQHAGHVVQAGNGGIFGYFGYPSALENSALNAVRAALTMTVESKPPLRIRVGVHCGLIVASPASPTPDAAGVTSATAMCLCTLNTTNGVVISQTTQQRTEGYFRLDEVDLNQRRGGLPKSITACRVLGPSSATHRLAATRRHTPFSGRESEMLTLLKLWAQARRGKPQAMLLTGTAGIGKSRLVEAFAKRISPATGVIYELRCFPETTQSPLQPVIALLETLCGFAAGDDLEIKQLKFDKLLTTNCAAQTEHRQNLLAYLMGLSTKSPYSTALPTEKPNEESAALIAELLLSLAENHPTILIAEDLHWADTSTLDLLHKLATAGTAAPLLIVMTTRPEWQAAWPEIPVMPLAPLADTEVTAMLDAIRADLSPSRRARIVTLAEGIPLFAEELASATDEYTDELPASLQELLMSRIDKLGSARPLAQLAATLGRAFDMRFLGSITKIANDDLHQAAHCLLASGLVVATGRQHHLEFKHALIQEAAYRSQTRAQQKAQHRRIAEAFEAEHPATCKNRPDLLARHWGAAREFPRAVPYWLQAGHRAASRFAHREAAVHFDTALKQLINLPPDIERDRLELELRIALAQSEQMVSGYGHARAAELLTGAIALLNRRACSGQALFQTVWGLWEGAGSRVDQGEAVRLAGQLIEIAEAENSPHLLQQAHYARGNSLLWTGDPVTSQHHLEIALSLEKRGSATPLRDCYGSIVLIGIKVYLSWVLWLRGHTGRAMLESQEALELARHHGDAYSLAFALTFAATLQRWLGNIDATRRLAEEGKTVAQSCESAVFEAALTMTYGWAKVMSGDARAVSLIELGIDRIRKAMSAVVVPLLAPYAEALLHLGEIGKARAVLEEALQQVEAKQDRHYLAELHRLKGLCLQAEGSYLCARTSLEQAIAIAHQQGALPFELRAKETLTQLMAEATRQ